MKAVNITPSFVEAGEDPAKALQAAEESLDFVAAPVHGAVVFPRGDPVGMGRNHRNETQIESQLTGFISLVSAIHDQMAAQRSGPAGLE